MSASGAVCNCAIWVRSFDSPSSKVLVWRVAGNFLNSFVEKVGMDGSGTGKPGTKQTA